MVLSSAPAWEEIGGRWFATFAGVVMVEATKQIYAGTAQPADIMLVYHPFRPRGSAIKSTLLIGQKRSPRPPRHEERGEPGRAST